MDEIPGWALQLHSALDVKLGFELLELAASRVVGRVPVDGNQQPFGLLHGGASAALIETLGSLGAAAHGRGMGKVGVGVDLHVTHLCAVRSGMITGTATAARLGRHLAVYDVELRDDAGRLSARGSLTCHLTDG